MKRERQIGGERIRGLWMVSAAIALVVVVLLIANGCVRHRTRTVVVASDEGVEVIYVETAPPAPPVEVITKRPGPKAVWIPGYWKWKGNKYEWIPGHWDKKPRGKVWAPGQWKKKPRGWIWVPGHWS